MTLIICRAYGIAVRRIGPCPTCQRRRRFVARDSLWNDPVWTCCACGDSWGEGQRLPRPFRRAWRPASIRTARAQWDQAVRWLGPEHSAWQGEELAALESATP